MDSKAKVYSVNITCPLSRVNNFLGFSARINSEPGIMPIPIDAQQIDDKFNKVFRQEEDRQVGHHRPFQGAAL